MSSVSVIIPTYNRADYIVETLETVLAQTHAPCEIIIVDNGSTDDTLDRLEPYADVVRIIQEAQNGMGGAYARNTGIKNAQGDCIAILDSDDLWHPSKLELQMARLKNDQNLAWVYSDSVEFEHDKSNVLYVQSKRFKLHEGMILKPLFMKNFIVSATPVIRREVFEQVGVYHPLPKATDWDMMLRIAARYPIALVPQILAYKRRHAANVTTSTGGQKGLNSSLEVVQRIVAQNDELKAVEPQALAQIYRANGLLLAKSSLSKEARAAFREVLKRQPSDLATYGYWLSTFMPKSLQKAAVGLRNRAWRA